MDRHKLEDPGTLRVSLFRDGDADVLPVYAGKVVLNARELGSVGKRSVRESAEITPLAVVRPKFQILFPGISTGCAPSDSASIGSGGTP